MGKRALTLNEVKAIKRPGRHAVGGGVVLQVREVRPGEFSRSWIVRYRAGIKQREMGLGPADAVTLAEARQAAQEARRLLRAKVDPIEHKRAMAAQAVAEAGKAITFETYAAKFIQGQAAGWRNPKHRQQWVNTLATYASPLIGTMPVGGLATSDVLRVLQPIWTEKPETATRVRMRLEAILDAAKAEGLAAGENPARWRGHLDRILPRRSKVAAVEHHAAMPWAEVPGFVSQLRKVQGTPARALELAILCASRTGEVLGAEWSEFDLGARVWSVPASRMKAGREHRVPLSDAALGLLLDVPRVEGTDLVFPGRRAGKPLSNMAFLMLLRRMGHGDVTAHGFRSSFRDWCAEATGHPAEIAEAALAHVIGDKTVAAYQRGDLLERRRRLMEDWGAHCAGPAAGVVVPLRRA